MKLNNIWEQYIKDKGAHFVNFVGVSNLPPETVKGFNSIILFGKVLSKEYIKILRSDENPKTHEFSSAERKMDKLAVQLADKLEKEGYLSTAKFKFAQLPHKTVALRAGLGFIGKNNLLVNDKYGCAMVMGKVLTTAPFETKSTTPMKPQCRDCNICIKVCPTKALHGKTWDINTTRDEIMVRKLCTCCLKCMIWCPYTGHYIDENN